MILLIVQNERQASRVKHSGGPVVLGRHPGSDLPQIIIDDQYVSRRQLVVEEMPGGYLRFDNVGRNDIELADKTRVQRGESGRVALPTRLQVGKTTIDILVEQADAVIEEIPPSAEAGSAYQTVSLPPQRTLESTDEYSLASLGEVPTPQKLAVWFETLLSVQRSAVGSAEFYEETARALVNLVGLDRGLVLLREEGRWRVAAGHAGDKDAGLKYSESVVSRAMSEARTFFGNPQDLGVRASLENLEAVVASPIFGQRNEVVGILYGSRDCGSEASHEGIQPLEAQVVQLLATSISSGLIRLEMQERLKQVEQLAAVGQVIGYIIHDLRGPLGNVQRLLEMLRDQQERSLRTEEQLDLIDESLAVSLDLLNDSLEFCRGVVRIEPVRGRFRDLLDKHLRLLRTDLETLGVGLNIEAPDDLQVFLDPDRIARVLRNLAKNAGEALRGREEPLVTIAARGSSDGTYLHIADNGPGLPSEVQRRMFQPFGTYGKRGGTGFGLAIARQLVEAHGGQISVVSGPRGTRFTIQLPGETDDDSTTTSVHPKLDVAVDDDDSLPDEVSRRNRRILLAEDGLVSQRLIASLLRSADHSVTIANNGQEAFEIWQANPFDLVLMDVEMPELDGLSATQKIREVERNGIGRTPIIALTAHLSDEMHARCRDAGMDGVMVKPLRTDELYRVIESLA